MEYTKIAKKAKSLSVTISNAVSLFLLIALAVEMTIGYLQLFHFYPSHHALYPVTGTFYNPGPYCCFLGMLLPIPFYQIIKKSQSTFIYWLSIVLFFSTIALMPILQGRTGWFAGIVGCLVVYITVHHIKTNVKCILLLVISGIVVLGLLYLIRPVSASGRILLWRVGWDALLQNPDGVGWNNVAGALGDAQEHYFLTHQSSKFVEVAGAPEYAFNEYLQIGIAFGIIGMLGFIFILVFSLYSSIQKAMWGLSGSITAFMIISCFSYPLQFNEFILTVGVVILATLVAPPWKFKWISLGLAIAVALTVLAASISTHKRTEIYNSPKKLLFDQGKALRDRGQLERSTEVLSKGLQISSDPMFLNLIGRNYEDAGDFKMAEHYYRRSAYRLPNRFYPLYRLAKLYARPEVADTVSFLKICDEFMDKPIKVPSPAIEQMKIDLTLLREKMTYGNQ